MLIANPTDAALAVSIERAAAGADSPPPIAAGAPFERRFTRSGSLALEVAPAAPGSRLEVRGAESETLAGADGSRAAGASMPAPEAGGTLFLAHGAGAVVAWIASGTSEPSDAGLEARPGAAEIVGLPAAIELAGERRDFAFELAAPAVLTLRSPAPAAVAVRAAAGAARAQVFAERLHWTVALPAGPATVELRGLGGETLGGRLEMAASPIAPAAEGLGAPVRLAPGSALGYGFTLDRERPVGVGAAAEGGATEVILFDAGGAPLGRGAALFRTLPAGDYRFALVAPPEGAPVLVRPVLVGLAPPSDAPPEAAVRALLAAERGEPPAARAIAGSQDARRWFESGSDRSDESDESYEGDVIDEESGEGDAMDGEGYAGDGDGSAEAENSNPRGAGADGGAR